MFVWSLVKRGCRRSDVVETRAIFPEDLAPLFVIRRQAEELLDGFGEGAVGIRIVRRDDKILWPHLVDEIDGRLLVDLEGDIALALEYSLGSVAI
jgi:hypothetical protein